MTKYEKLNEYLNKILENRYLSTILNWEMDTVAPKKAFPFMINIKTKFEMEAFNLLTSEEYINLLKDVITSSEFATLPKEVQITLQEMAENYERDKRVPTSFYEEYCTLISNSNNAWAEAKEKNDYNIFKPFLKDVIDYTKKYYTYMYPNEDLYNSMLDTYEKGIKKDTIDHLFDELKKALIPLVKNLKPAKKIPSTKDYDNSKLLEIAKYLLEYIGFDNNRGALGIYPHGYTTKLNNDDIRITFSAGKSIFDHVCTVIHEGGHGIFEQNINSSLKSLGISDVNKYALHESQSRFFENILGRNINFWIPIYEDIKKSLELDIPIEEFVSYLNNAQPSLIRTEADELTYCLHIIMRYEIERDLFDNKITVDELPNIWASKTKEYFGLEINDDNSGILQDVHWSYGNFGYFPSYLIGSIFDGMLLETINKELGSVDTLLKENRIKEITKFLNENIHAYGGAYGINEVANRLCHTDLTVKPLINYFKDKYEK